MRESTGFVGFLHYYLGIRCWVISERYTTKSRTMALPNENNIWAMNHLLTGETPSISPEHPFPRFLNWPIVSFRKKKMEEAFENMVTVALTATDVELQIDMVRVALLQSQQHQFVHVDEHHKVVAELREHKERILALEEEVSMLKDGELRRRSNTEPQNEYEGCSLLGAHATFPLYRTPHTDIYVDDMGGVGCSDVETGLGLLTSSREHADDTNIDHPSIMVGRIDGVHIEVHTGEHYTNGASNPTSNIATRIKDNPRMCVKSVRLDPPLTRSCDE